MNKNFISIFSLFVITIFNSSLNGCNSGFFAPFISSELRVNYEHNSVSYNPFESAVCLEYVAMKAIASSRPSSIVAPVTTYLPKDSGVGRCSPSPSAYSPVSPERPA